MTLKEIKEHYKIMDHNKEKGKKLLFSNVPGSDSRMVYKYLCTISQVKKYFVIYDLEGFAYAKVMNITSLKNRVDKFVKSLPYDSGYYNPNFIKGLTEELIICDYLRELGFKKHGYSTEVYTLSQKNVYGYISTDISLMFSGLDRFEAFDWETDEPKMNNKTTVYLHTGPYSSITSTVDRNVEDIKKAIDSLLKPLLISDSVNNFSTSEKIKNVDMDIQILFEKISMKDYSTISVDFKQELKKNLTALIEKL